jgi:predicted nucleotidyltransferase
MSTLESKSSLLPPWVLVRNRCDPALIDGRFVPLIDEAIAAYLETPSSLTDIRLQGSVARGEAIVGQSDIDFMALVAGDPPDDEVCARLQDQAARLSGRFPVVYRVELDAAPLADLSPFQRFALSSDSLSVYGTDSLTQREQRIDRVELARLVTPPAAELISNYRALVEKVRAGVDEAEMRFYSRIVGKDLLNACARSSSSVGVSTRWPSAAFMARSVPMSPNWQRSQIGCIGFTACQLPTQI